MSYETKLMSGIILLSIVTIQYGGYFLLTILSGKQDHLQLNAFQKSMFRAGHAHAGVLVILAILAQVLVDYTTFSPALEWFTRAGFPFAAILVSAGFFGAASGKGVERPTKLIWILYAGAVLLAISLLVLGLGLILA
jgi:Ni,Fe-hydrogenase I cytochrome b subunit